MAEPVGVQVQGGRQLRAALKGTEDGLTKLKAAHTVAAGIVTARAAALAPRRTGALAGTVRGTGANTSATVRAGYNARVRYANPIHWGWYRRGIMPSLFLTRAAADTEPAWVPGYFAAVQTLIDTQIATKALTTAEG